MPRSIYEALFHWEFLSFFFGVAFFLGITGGMLLLNGWPEEGAGAVLAAVGFTAGGWLYARTVMDG